METLFLGIIFLCGLGLIWLGVSTSREDVGHALILTVLGMAALALSTLFFLDGIPHYHNLIHT